MLLLHFRLSLILLQEKLLNVLLELKLLLFFALKECILSFLIREHLFRVFLLLYAELVLMDPPQVPCLLISLLVNLLLLKGQVSCSVLKLHLLLFDLLL